MSQTVVVTDGVDEPSSSSDAWARRRIRIAKEIEHAALVLFAVDGPDSVTVEQIAEAAGISVRTFFRYFPNRDEVMFAVPRRQVDEMCALVAARPATESVLDAFIAAVHESVEDWADDELMRLWGRTIRQWDVTKAPQQPGSHMVEAYGEVIASRLGLAPRDVRVEVMATAIASVMWLAFLRWLSSDDERTVPVVVEECFQVLRDLDSEATARVRRRIR